VHIHLKSVCQRCTLQFCDPAWNTWVRAGHSGPPTFVNSGTAGGTPHEFDCASRAYAWEYGKQLRPERGKFRSLFDALQLQACNITLPRGQDEHPEWRPPTLSVPAGAAVFVVEAAAGGTTASVDGSYDSIAAALEAARQTASARPRYILLKGGVHYLRQTLRLTAADSWTTFQNYKGEHAIISGGHPLNLTSADWVPASAAWAASGTYAAKLPNVSQLSGLRISQPAASRDAHAARRVVRARYPNANPLTAMAQTALGGWIAQPTTWVPPTAPRSPPTDYWITGADWPGVEWPLQPKGAPLAYNSSATCEKSITPHPFSPLHT
jgi:hypothetical protein